MASYGPSYGNRIAVFSCVSLLLLLYATCALRLPRPQATIMVWGLFAVFVFRTVYLKTALCVCK